jgi:hypothetical protein
MLRLGYIMFIIQTFHHSFQPCGLYSVTHPGGAPVLKCSLILLLVAHAKVKRSSLSPGGWERVRERGKMT